MIKDVEPANSTWLSRYRAWSAQARNWNKGHDTTIALHNLMREARADIGHHDSGLSRYLPPPRRDRPPA